MLVDDDDLIEYELLKEEELNNIWNDGKNLAYASLAQRSYRCLLKMMSQVETKRNNQPTPETPSTSSRSPETALILKEISLSIQTYLYSINY